jgi:hypothetical protein
VCLVFFVVLISDDLISMLFFVLRINQRWSCVFSLTMESEMWLSSLIMIIIDWSFSIKFSGRDIAKRTTLFLMEVSNGQKNSYQE